MARNINQHACFAHIARRSTWRYAHLCTRSQLSSSVRVKAEHDVCPAARSKRATGQPPPGLPSNITAKQLRSVKSVLQAGPQPLLEHYFRGSLKLDAACACKRN